jgi:hypothetical protein
MKEKVRRRRGLEILLAVAVVIGFTRTINNHNKRYRYHTKKITWLNASVKKT